MKNYIYYDLNHPNRYGPFIEEWQKVIGFERYYEISNYGRLKSLQKYQTKPNGSLHLMPERILSNLNSRKIDWYIKYTLCVNMKMTYVSAHVLVATHFIDNPDGKIQVNHKDGIKSNPFVGNLEWVTPSENRYHAYETGLQGCYQSRMILDTSTGVYFDNIRDAEFSMGYYRGKLQRMINGKCENSTMLIAV